MLPRVVFSDSSGSWIQIKEWAISLERTSIFQYPASKAFHISHNSSVMRPGRITAEGSNLGGLQLFCVLLLLWRFLSSVVTKSKQILLTSLSCFLRGSDFLKHVLNLIRFYFTKESKLENSTCSLAIFTSTNHKTKPKQQRVKPFCAFVHLSCGLHGKKIHAKQL